MKEPAQNLSMSSGNMSKLNTGTLQKGIIGPVLVNASMHTINMKLFKSVSYCKNTKIFIFHITSVETVKALVGLHKFKAAPEMPLLAHAFTIITWISQF